MSSAKKALTVSAGFVFLLTVSFAVGSNIPPFRAVRIGKPTKNGSRPHSKIISLQNEPRKQCNAYKIPRPSGRGGSFGCNRTSVFRKTESYTGKVSGIYKAGTYTAGAEGYEGSVTIEVEFDHDSILSVRVVEENETKEIGGRAIDTLPKEIVEAQTYAVDAFSGATITSNAIKTSVEDCIKQAAVF